MQTAKDKVEAKGDHQEKGKDNEQKKEAETVDEEERKVTTQSSETVTEDHRPTEMQTAKDKDEKRENVKAKVQERGNDKETDRNQAPPTNNKYQEAGGGLKPGASPENPDHENEDASQTELTHNNGENNTWEDTEGEEEEGASEENAMREKPTGRTGETAEEEGAEGHTEEKGSNKNQTAKTTKQDTANIAAGDDNAGEEGGDGNSIGSKTLPTSTCVFGEHGSLNVLASPKPESFSFLPGNTSTPRHSQEPGSRNVNDGKAFSESSTGVRGRSRKTASRQKKQSSYHSAKTLVDSGMGKSLSASSSTSAAEMSERTRQLEELKENLEDQVAVLYAEVQRKDNDTYGLWDTVARQSRALHGKERLEVEHQDVVTKLSDSQRQCVTLQASVTDLTSNSQMLEAALAQKTEDHTHQVTELDREGEVKDEKINELLTIISGNSEKVANAEELTRGYQDMDQRRQHAEQSCSSLQRRLDEATNKVQELQETTEGLGKEIVQLQANLYRLTNERDELQTTSQDQVSQLTGERDALRANCDRLNGWVEELTNAKACLEGDKNDLEGKLRRTEKEKNNLITDHEVLEAQKNSSEAALREMSERTRRLEELKENLEGQAAALHAEVQQKDNDMYGLLDTVARQSRALEGKERLEVEHQDVVTRLGDSQHQCATLQASVTELTGRTQRLEAALAQETEDHTREANALKVRVYELSNELGDLQETSEREVASLVEVRGTLRSDCDRLNVRVDELETNKKRLEDQVTELDREGEVKDEKINELLTIISGNSEKVANAEVLTRGYQDMDQRRQHAEQSCSSLQRRLDEATDKVQQLEAALEETNEGLGQEIVQLQANLYRLTNERDELQTTLQDQVSQLTGDRDALRAKCDRLDGFVEELTNAKASLEDAKHDLEGKLRRTDRERTNLITAHDDLEAQKNSSEAALREMSERTRQLEELKENLEGQAAALQAEVQRKDNDAYGLLDTVARQSRALEGKERLEVEHQDVVTRLSDSQHQCATLQASVRELTGRTQRLEAALAQEIEDHTREANALKVRVHELSNELGDLQESSEREVASLAEVRGTLRSDCDRLNVRVDELETNKKRLEDKNTDLKERLRATERKAEELTTQNRVIERQKKTAEDQSVAYGQTSTFYQAQATQLQDLANANRAQLETLTAQLRQRNESVLPLEMEARRASLEAQETAARLERRTNEKDTLEITVNALKEEVQLNALAIQDWHRKEAELRREVEKQVAQKNRYVTETQLARTQVKKLEERVHQLELQEANRFRREFPRLDNIEIPIEMAAT